jgi:hypothetical protein
MVTTNNNTEEGEMEAVPEVAVPEVRPPAYAPPNGLAITGFGVWQEDRSVQLLCPPCFINSTDYPVEDIYSDEVDWLHPGGPKERCVRCGRDVN